MRPRAPSLLLAIVVGCAARPVPPVTVSPSLLPPPPASPPAVEAPSPSPAEQLAPLLARLTPSDTPRTLLLGLEVVPSVGYGPLYGSGPELPPDDKYRTLVIRHDGGRAELLGELPFLAVPQASGFLYLGVASYARDDTEAERRRLGKRFGADDPVGSRVYWYAASSLWRTTERGGVDAARKLLRERHKRAFKRGIFGGEDVGYVTSRAMCTTSYNAEWEGGAIAFRGSETEWLEGFGKPLPRELSAYTDDAGILAFAREILRRREPGEPEPDVSLDKPSEMFFTEVSWRKESHACLARERGRVYLTGVVSLPNNSARSSEWEVPIREAPPELAPSGALPLDLADVRRAFDFPKPRDVVVSPGPSVLVVQLRDRFLVYGAGAPAPLLSIPVSGRIVMAEWASGDAARAWAQVGDPPKPAIRTECACEVGAVCAGGACVTPKRVFITSTLYTGNLGGLAGADARCQERARAGALTGQYKAWLSDSTTSAAARLTHARVPYVLVDGTWLARDWAGLTQGSLRGPIELTELAERPTRTPHPNGCGEALVWTGTKEDGSAIGERSCQDWTDGASPPGQGKGAVWGDAAGSSLWSSECKSELAGCNGSFPLYCVEQ